MMKQINGRLSNQILIQLNGNNLYLIGLIT